MVNLFGRLLKEHDGYEKVNGMLTIGCCRYVNRNTKIIFDFLN